MYKDTKGQVFTCRCKQLNQNMLPLFYWFFWMRRSRKGCAWSQHCIGEAYQNIGFSIMVCLVTKYTSVGFGHLLQLAKHCIISSIITAIYMYW